jgi:hypothetical protein
MELIKIVKRIKQSFPAFNPINNQLLINDFKQKKYARLISTMKNHLKIPCRLMVKCLNYPQRETGRLKGANICLPEKFPLYGTKEYENLNLTLNFHKELLNNYYSFVMMISHELSHIILYSLNHPLKKSEKATDITAIVLGFAYFFELGHTIIEEKNFRLTCYKNGYLSFEELVLILNYLDDHY